MRVLIIKTSSMGDVIHTLPALTDAVNAIPSIRFDWVVEESFEEIPRWHPAVDEVIPVAIRRWRKSIFATMQSAEWKQCKQLLSKRHYDCVIDAQGLLKSAWLARYTRAPRFGYDKDSVRERLASLAYHHKISVSKKLHAVERNRQLFAAALGYKLPIIDGRLIKGEYGLEKSRFSSSGSHTPNVVFLHSTSRLNKHWPETYWYSLCEQLTAKGFKVYLPWGSDDEKLRAQRIADKSPLAEVLPKLNLRGVAEVIAKASAIVSVDTGLGHLSAALDIPTVSLYGPTSPRLVGAYGRNQFHLCAGDLVLEAADATVEKNSQQSMAIIKPELVFEKLMSILTENTQINPLDQ